MKMLRFGTVPNGKQQPFADYRFFLYICGKKNYAANQGQ
jgi:hypothetical protein